MAVTIEIARALLDLTRVNVVQSARGEALDRLLEEGHTPLETHVRARRIAAAEAIADRTRIYLDTNFWVNLRKAESGIGAPAAGRLLAALKHGVSAGRLICPLSESAFIELFNQQDLVTRRATAQLMDELSLGYCLADPQTRMATEVAHYFHDRLGYDVYSVDKLVWAKASYALGVLHPVPPDFVPPEVALAIQKGVFDETWGASLTMIVDTIDASPVPSNDDLEAAAARMNLENDAHSHQIRSFRQTLKAEVQGVASCFDTTLREVAQRLEGRLGVAPPAANSDQWRAILDLLSAVTAAELEKGKEPMRLPSLAIEAALHASNRWDRHRRLDAHDLLDFRHASAALAYCDAFFTEKPLRSMIEQKHIALDRRFRCPVRATVDEAVAYVETLDAAR